MTEQKETFPDPTDRAALESDRNFMLRIRDREHKLIKKVKKALDRIENGTFGICDKCGEDISIARSRQDRSPPSASIAKPKRRLLKKPLASDPHAGIDLHVHSTASDGTLTPPEILEMAVQLGLKAISITDHDTLCGSAAALANGIPQSLEFLSGIEISAASPDGYPSASSVHVLGYGFDLYDASLNQLLTVLQSSRKNRNPQIIERLNTLGMDVSMEELAQVVGDAAAGRPHIAQLMVAKGLVDSFDNAFDRFLGKNKPAYVEKYRVPIEDAIECLKNAGRCCRTCPPVSK
jgi:predicted metal-dependent phosphoesterase TrpH